MKLYRLQLLIWVYFFIQILVSRKMVTLCNTSYRHIVFMELEINEYVLSHNCEVVAKSGQVVKDVWKKEKGESRDII